MERNPSFVLFDFDTQTGKITQIGNQPFVNDESEQPIVSRTKTYREMLIAGEVELTPGHRPIEEIVSGVAPDLVKKY